MEFTERKPYRLENYDYSKSGTYFITICVKDRKPILSKIVGTGVPDCPKTLLLPYGKIAEKYINKFNNFYNDIFIDKYVIMPDHIHFLLSISDGQSRTPVPTRSEIKIDNKNSTISKFVSTFKRFCNKEYGNNIWQSRYYDHIIRNQDDYKEKWDYIENNPKSYLLKNTQDE